jgi:hypothetical protein
MRGGLGLDGRVPLRPRFPNAQRRFTRAELMVKHRLAPGSAARIARDRKAAAHRAFHAAAVGLKRRTAFHSVIADHSLPRLVR